MIKYIELASGEVVPSAVVLKGKQKGKRVEFVYRFWTTKYNP